MMAQSSPPSPQSDLFDSINELKSGVADIKADIRLKLSVSNFSKVTWADIKGSQKLVKQNVAEHLLKILKLSDNVTKINNISDPDAKSSLNFVDTESIKNLSQSITSTIDDKLKSIVDNSLSETLTKIIGKELEKLQSFKDELHLLKQQDNAHDDHTVDSNMSPPAPPTRLSTPDTEPHISKCVENFISEEESSELCDFLSKVEFKKENGHGVKNFGELYRYTGAGDSSPVRTEMPGIFQPIIKKISEEYPDCLINECLVNCYGVDSHIKEHSDDEFEIDPESNIFCLSLGQERGMVFKDRASHVETTHVARDRSLYVMTRSSQDYYTHRIDQDSTSNSAVRYSLTFRHIGERFKNSTVIIGDSNTKDFKFGEGFGTFGGKIPGKRVKAANVEDINPHDCAGFSNVVIVTGTNNLRSKYISSRADIVKVHQTLQDKICAIQGIRNDIKITIMPVLPTRLREMNRPIMCYNRMIYDKFVHAETHFNIKMGNVCEFLDDEQLLRRDLSRTGDAIHLNDRGISVFVPCIKNLILNRIPRTFSQALTGDGKGTT